MRLSKRFKGKAYGLEAEDGIDFEGENFNKVDISDYEKEIDCKVHNKQKVIGMQMPNKDLNMRSINTKSKYPKHTKGIRLKKTTPITAVAGSFTRRTKKGKTFFNLFIR